MSGALKGCDEVIVGYHTLVSSHKIIVPLTSCIKLASTTTYTNVLTIITEQFIMYK